MKKYPAILSALYNTPHLVSEQKLQEIDAFVRRHAFGEPRSPVAYEDGGERPEPMVATLYDAAGKATRLTANQLAADQYGTPAATPSQEFVAVLPLFGTIFQHGSMEVNWSGGTSTEQWQQQLRKLDANAAVKSIIIEVHSPGGQCIGTMETADLVRSLRDAGNTRIVSISNSQMASAACWIGTAAKEVYCTPGGEIGSIGVVSLHWDYSKAYTDMGIKPTLIATSQKKIMGNELEPLSQEARAMFEADNQVIYQNFLKGMAANRGTTPAKVESDFGGGAMLWAKDAVKAGLADGVLTMQQLVDREVGRLNKGGKAAGKKSMRNAVAIAQAQQD